MAPEIGVGGDGFPSHGSRGRIRQPIKAIHQADGRARHSVRTVGGQRTARATFIAQRRNDIGEEIRRDAHVGVADENQIVLREFFFKMRKLWRPWCSQADEIFADDELRVAL